MRGVQMDNKLYIFERFKYFVECYFNIDANYVDIEKLAVEYKMLETQESTERLIDELKKIIILDNWQYVSDFVYEHGFRRSS